MNCFGNIERCSLHFWSNGFYLDWNIAAFPQRDPFGERPQYLNHLKFISNPKQRINKVRFIKYQQVRNLFSNTNKFYGDFKLVGDCQYYPTLCSSIELGDG